MVERCGRELIIERRRERKEERLEEEREKEG
jgi:hypothetical protein